MSEPISERRASNRRALIVLTLAVIGSASMLYYHTRLFLPRVQQMRAARGLDNANAFGGDFYPIWLTSRQSLAGRHDLYTAETTQEIQKGLFGHPLTAQHPTDLPADYRVFAYPAFTDLLFWPAAMLGFPTLRFFLVGVLAIIAAGTIWLWMRALEWRVHPVWLVTIMLLAFSSYPVLEALFAEQPGLIVGFLLALSLVALRRNSQSLAGLLLAMTTIKPQVTLLVILYLLLWSCQDWRRRKRLALSFLATISLLVGASVLVWPHWIGAWLGITFRYYGYAPLPLAALLLGSAWAARMGSLLIITLLAAAAVLAWKTRRAEIASREFWVSMSLLLAITSVALLPGQAVYDHIILLPGILILARDRHAHGHLRLPTRALRTIGATVFFWPWVAAFAMVLARLFMTPEHFHSLFVLALPIRTAASLPFVVLALLALTARSSTRPFAMSPR